MMSNGKVISFHTNLIYRKLVNGEISLEAAFDSCDDGHEVSELVRMLAKDGRINEQLYNEVMSSLAQQGKLDRFT